MTTSFREVLRTFNLAEADFVSSRLIGAGLHPTVQNEQSAMTIVGPASGGIRVIVPAGEYEEASKLLASSQE